IPGGPAVVADNVTHTPGRPPSNGNAPMTRSRTSSHRRTATRVPSRNRYHSTSRAGSSRSTAARTRCRVAYDTLSHRPPSTRCTDAGRTSATAAISSTRDAPRCTRRRTATASSPTARSGIRNAANSPDRAPVSSTTATIASSRARSSTDNPNPACRSHRPAPAMSTNSRYNAVRALAGTTCFGAGCSTTGNRTRFPGTTTRASMSKQSRTIRSEATGNGRPTSCSRDRSIPAAASSQNGRNVVHVNNCAADLAARPGSSSRPTARSNMPTTIQSWSARDRDT
ncbi:hypothetical protein, partial [Streptomyces fradiae]